MRALYDLYFQSSDYQRRYPRPNPGTLAFLWRHGLARARCVADVGCGNGRYALPLLDAGAVRRLVACDLSPGALDALAQRLARHPLGNRVQPVLGGPEALPRQERFDRLLMMFGVLSHIGPRAARLQALRELRDRAAPDARLLLSVPTLGRRWPLELLASLFQPGHESWGDVRYARTLGGQRRQFYYHLYSLRGLREDLALGGWILEAAEAESLAPEWLVTRWPRWGRIDAALQPWVPACLGYGIRVVARPAPEP
ncbi:class I SAM-dependent methyltransferase [Ramlibacter rhizophilus]|uniref:Class I SAM-dependent methyltransferase n=2 Tax=Ramlibacter rhizophilus TaxID=1781167 RepID=A0A4Z0BXS3_9BURK|nr:class I SAM-dependent methyltransferase [Ramlibacter rhizophilus]